MFLQIHIRGETVKDSTSQTSIFITTNVERHGRANYVAIKNNYTRGNEWRGGEGNMAEISGKGESTGGKLYEERLESEAKGEE